MINLSRAKGAHATSMHLRRGALAARESGLPNRSLSERSLSALSCAK